MRCNCFYLIVKTNFKTIPLAQWWRWTGFCGYSDSPKPLAIGMRLFANAWQRKYGFPIGNIYVSCHMNIFYAYTYFNTNIKGEIVPWTEVLVRERVGFQNQHFCAEIKSPFIPRYPSQVHLSQDFLAGRRSSSIFLSLPANFHCGSSNRLCLPQLKNCC